jgi:HEAT repeat protein
MFEDIVEMLKSADCDMCRLAAAALGELGDIRAVEPLIDMLVGDEDEFNREVAAVALGKLGDIRAVEPLISQLRGLNWLQDSAAKSLGLLGDPRAVEPLIILLKNKYGNEYARKGAAKSLGLLRDSRAVEPLIDCLSEDTVYEEVFIALGRLKDPRAVEPLISLLMSNEETFFDGWALNALSSIGGERAILGIVSYLRRD